MFSNYAAAWCVRKEAYRENLHWRLDNDIKQFPLPGLCIQMLVVPPLNPDDTLEHVSNHDVSSAILVREMEDVARCREL